MNPFQKNKVDMNALSPEEQKAFRMYGKLPNRKDVLQNKLKERKYFDSGDYALSKAGATSEISPTDVGREHPVPENIPHLSTSPSGTGSTSERSGSISERASLSGPSGITTGGPNFLPPNGVGKSASPVKESSWLQREQSIDDQPGEEDGSTGEAERDGVPIRGARPGGS